ncbi:MAG: purine-nucleoside phosphorylase [Eubacteriales bacterium]|nr:purine-nucleoside phosphorylase [Eubacteriales bacterium]
MDPNTYRRSREAADWLLKRTSVRPDAAVILGSSLGAIEARMSIQDRFFYGDIPGFLTPTNPSHAGHLLFGELGGQRAVIMSGRFHHYEGFSYQELAIPVLVLSFLGVKTLIVTNAAGGINLNYKVGDIMLIGDHINLVGADPTAGPIILETNPRFYDVSYLYSKGLRKLAHETASEQSPPIQLQEGNYYFATGPHFETPAEIKAMRILGGDAVGMSTVTETLTAAYSGMEVLGFSLITNMAAGVLDQKLTDEEVGIAAKAAADRLGALIEGVLKKKG